MLECTHYHSRPEDIRTVGRANALVPIDGAIYWHLDERYITTDLNKLKLVVQFDKAFAEWQPYFLPVKFKSTTDKSKAAIVIHFMQPDDPALPAPFDNNTLAYAYFPQRESLGIHADMYFNDKYQWAEKHSVSDTNLFKVIVHELGHSFGLHHSTDIRDIMYPTYQPNDEVIITADTLDGINELYGTVTPTVKDSRKLIKRLFSRPHGVSPLSNHHIKVLCTHLGVPYFAQAMRVTKARLQHAIDSM